MGNAFPKEQTLGYVKVLLQGVVKNVPWDSILRLLLIRNPLRLDRLELQEDVLRNLGVLLPLRIKAAWLEEVVVTQESFLRLRVGAKHFYGYADVSDAGAWQEESGSILRAEAEARSKLRLHDVVAPGALLARTLPHPLAAVLRRSPVEVELDLGGAELVLGHASPCRSSLSSLTMTASRVSSAGPMKMSALSDDKPQCQAKLSVETPEIRLTINNSSGVLGPERTPSSCARADVRMGIQGAIGESTPKSRGVIFGPCELLEAEMRVNSPGDQEDDTTRTREPPVTISMRIADCGAGLRVSLEQIPCLMRLAVAWELWTSFLCGLAPPRPTAGEAKEYRRRWLQRLELAVPPALEGEQDPSPALAAFEASHSLQQILGERELALLEWELERELDPEAPKPDSSLCLGSSSSSRPRDQVCLDDFRISLEVSGLVSEVYQSRTSRTASLRLLFRDPQTSQHQRQCSLGFKLQGRIDPGMAISSAQASLADFHLEAEAAEQTNCILSHQGLLCLHLDLVAGRRLAAQGQGKGQGQGQDSQDQGAQDQGHCPLGGPSLLIRADELHLHFDSEVVSGLQDLLLPLFDLLALQCEEFELGVPGSSSSSSPEPALAKLAFASNNGIFIVLTGGPAAGLLALQFRVGVCEVRCAPTPAAGSEVGEEQRRGSGEGEEGEGGGCSPCPQQVDLADLQLCEIALWAGVQTAEKSPWLSAQQSFAAKIPLMGCPEVSLQLQRGAATLTASPLSFCLPAPDLELLLPVLLKWQAAWVCDLQVAWCTLWGEGEAAEYASEYAPGSPGPEAFSQALDLHTASMSCFSHLRSVQVSLPSVEAAFSLGDGARCPKAAVVLRMKRQQLHLNLSEAAAPGPGCSTVAMGSYVLQHVSISDASGESHLLHCGSFQEEEGSRALSARCHLSGSPVSEHRPSFSFNVNVAPLWVACIWRSVSLMLNYALRLQRTLAVEGSSQGDGDSDAEPFCRPPADQEVESSVGSRGDATPLQCWYSTAESEEQPAAPSLSDISCKFQFTVERFLFMLPCCGSRGMLLCCEWQASCATSMGRSSGTRFVVSQLSLSPAMVPRRRGFESFRAPKGPLPNASFLLHPARFTITISQSQSNRSVADAEAEAEVALPSPCIRLRLEVAPLCLSLRSTHMPLARGLGASLRRLLAERECGTDVGVGVGVDAPLPLPVPVPVPVPGAASFSFARCLQRLQGALAPLLEVDSWTMQLEVVLAGLRLGIIQSPSDTELLTCLAEDFRAQGRWEAKSCKLSSLASVASWSTQLAASRSYASPRVRPWPAASQPGRLLSLSARLHALSMDNTATDTAKPMPLLEPVHASLTYAEGLCHKTSRCDVSWLNVNLSMALVDTVVNLIRGISSQGVSSTDGWDEVSGSASQRSTSRPKTQCPLEDCLRGGLRQHTISARQPELRFYNHLWQGVQLAVQPEDQEVFLDHGETWSTQIPWNAVVREERQNAEAKIRFFLTEEATVKVRLSPTPSVQALPVQPPSPTMETSKYKPGLQLSRSWSGSKSEQSELNSSGGDRSWLLVRRRVSGTLNQLEIHLSSLLFLENRTSLSISVAPLDSGPWMVLPPGAAPQPVPLAWCLSREAGRSPATLWCGLTSAVKCDCANIRAHSCRRDLRSRGLLQPLFGRASWRSLCRYRSMVAEDYFLRARELNLRDQSGAVAANLSASVYGVSADLHAPLQALFFSVALEPLVQVCNRLCHELQLRPEQAPLAPGEDAELLCLSEALSLRISTRTQAWHMQQQIWADRMRKDGHQRRLPFFEELESSRAVASCSPSPGLFVTLATEPGLAVPEWWAPLRVHQYSPRARRLILFTHYWLVNRRNDCCIYVPRRQGSRSFARGKEQLRQEAFRHVQCDQTLMLSDDHSIHRGRLQLGVSDSPGDGRGPEVGTGQTQTGFPLTESFQVDRPTKGAVMARRSKQEASNRCLGFTVHPAPLPFYRTLIVEVVRRFTLLNHTERPLWFLEGDGGSPSSIPKGRCVPFDPQGTKMKLAITGVDPGMGKCGAVLEHYSAFFALCVDDARSCVQLMHQTDLNLSEPGSACLAIPEPVRGQASASTGWTWCLTNVDIRLEGSSVLVRFSDPLRPDFRLVNRSSSSVEVGQDCVGAPRFVLQPEHQMSFCWFRSMGPQRLRVDLGGQQQCYDIGAVQKHWPPLHLHYPPRSGETIGWQEEFHVRTCVHRGSREVHIHPWCRLTNQKREALVVREASGNSQGRLVHSGESICLQPEPSGVLSLQVRCSLQQSQGGWSQPVRLAKVLSGSRGFLRHLKRGGSGVTSTFEITTVEITQDPTSDFLLVELKPHVESTCPYLLENLSSLEVMVTQAGEATDRAEATLLPGERLPFLPLGLDSQTSGGCCVWVQTLRGGETPSSAGRGTMVDIEKPQEQPAGLLHLSVLKERPRRMLLRNGETVSEVSRRTSCRQSPGPGPGLGPGSFPALLLARRFLPTAAHLKKSGVGGWPEAATTSLQSRSAVKALATSGTATASLSAHGAPRPQQSGGGARAGAGRGGGSQQLRLPRVPQPLLLWRSGARGAKATSRSSRQASDEESPRLSPSMAKRLRRGSEDVFWQRSPFHKLTPRRSHRRGSSQADFHLEGCGVSLIDAAALQEVAYLCADGLDAHLTWSLLPRRVLDVALRSLQLDVTDSTGWRSSNMLRPWRGPLPLRRQPEEPPFISLHARWLALDQGAGSAAHLEVESLSWQVLSVEARLDTMNCFKLAHWALELEAHAAPLLGQARLLRGETVGKQRTPWAAGAADSASASLGATSRECCPGPGDFASPTPVFIRRLFAHRVQFVLSVRFSGKRDCDCQGSEELQALHHVLRKLLPFDVSQASIAVGVGTKSPARARDREAWLRDEFLPRGLTWDRVSQELQSCSSSILRQVPKLLGAGRLIGSPSHLCFELAKAAKLILLGLRVCDWKAVVAALFLGLAAFFESAEGILVILAKTACRLSAGTVPTGLWKEPSGVPGAIMDLVWYGFPWHIRQSYREWKRQMHIACSSQSCRLALCGIVKGLLHTLALMGSALLLMAAKLLQVAHLASAELARCACPEHVAELGAPSALRVGPTLFRHGVPLQFAPEARAVLAAVSTCASGTRHCDWRLLPLPAGEGTLVAVPGCGFFLLRSSSGSCCLPSPREAGRVPSLHVVWQALGSWQSTELLPASNLNLPASPWGAWLLRLRSPDCNRACAELRLRSSEAAFAAFGFVQDCLVHCWTDADVPSNQGAAIMSGSRVLLRRVRRSAQTRASV